MLFTARKRSLGQGNIFAPVCHSVHGGVWYGGCLVSEGYLVSGGAWSQVVPGLRWCLVPRGGAWSWGVWSRGVPGPRGMPGLGGCLILGGAWWRPPRDGHCCGRYASYWNAFLFALFLLKMANCRSQWHISRCSTLHRDGRKIKKILISNKGRGTAILRVSLATIGYI